MLFLWLSLRRTTAIMLQAGLEVWSVEHTLHGTCYGRCFVSALEGLIDVTSPWHITELQSLYTRTVVLRTLTYFNRNECQYLFFGMRN